MAPEAVKINEGFIMKPRLIAKYHVQPVYQITVQHLTDIHDSDE
jgi:hypothetical protein